MKLLFENWRNFLNEEEIGRSEQYIKHAALNLGIAARQGKKLISGDRCKIKRIGEGSLLYTSTMDASYR